MQTCALDLCLLFNACYENVWFREMYVARTHSSPIRYQLGYNYSENRNIKWTNVAQLEEGFEGAVVGWRENKIMLNNSVIAHHRELNTIIVLF